MAIKPQEDAPPELKFLLEGEDRHETREAIVAAFYDLCQGDPTSYPVQYALVQRAHLRAMARHAARTDEVLTAALQLAKVMQQESGKQERAAEGLTLQMATVEKRVGEAVALEKRLSQFMENSAGSIQSQALNAIKGIETATHEALQKLSKDTYSATERVRKTAESLDSKSLFTAMMLGAIIGAILTLAAYHVIRWQWP